MVREADDVVKTIVEIIGRELQAVRSKFLIKPGAPAFAGFGLEIGIAGKARIRAEGLIEARFLDALSVEDPVAGVTPKTMAVAEEERATRTRNDARAKILVRFRANAKIKREARERRKAEVQVAPLIVAAKMSREDIGNRAVFDFVLITSSGGEIPQQVGSLYGRASAIVFQQVVVDEIAEFGGWSGGGGLLCGTGQGGARGG